MVLGVTVLSGFHTERISFHFSKNRDILELFQFFELGYKINRESCSDDLELITVTFE